MYLFKLSTFCKENEGKKKKILWENIDDDELMLNVLRHLTAKYFCTYFFATKALNSVLYI